MTSSHSSPDTVKVSSSTANSSANVASSAAESVAADESHVIDAASPAADETLFADYKFHESINQDLVAAGFERPTPIQAACIAPAMEGRDIIGLAQTGTGKTAAFALPIIQKLALRTELGALVLAPTRELAAQISAVFEQLGQSSGIRVATIVGGTNMDLDYRALKSWPNVLVATPGRLIDHIQSGTVHLEEIEVLVVDEADRMHDMGFIPQIRRIVRHLPKTRQTMMFTATMDREVEEVVRESMTDPLKIQVGQKGAPAQRAEQHLYAVTEDERTPLLVKLLRSNGDSRVLIFVRTKRGVDRLARSIQSAGLSAARIHGDREQCQRDEAMAGFRDGTYRILIATDIAARGIDVANIGHVINYDFPRHAEDYVHRIGRTARVEASGLAISFVTRADRQALAAVKKLIGDKLPPLTASPLGSADSVHLVEEVTHRREGGHGRRGGRGGHGEGRGRGPGDGPGRGGEGGGRGRGPRREGRSHSGRGSSQPATGRGGPAVAVAGEASAQPSSNGPPQAAAGAPAEAGPDGRPRRRRHRGGRGRRGAQGQAAGQPQPESPGATDQASA